MATVNITGLAGVLGASAAQWDDTTAPVPKDVLAYERDTGRSKIGDGVTLYAALPYYVDQVFTEQHLGYLQAPNTANSAILLDSTTGKLPSSLVPSASEVTLTIVADIAERDILDGNQLLEDRRYLVLVKDATGDPTVESGAALYALRDGLNGETPDNQFTKMFEVESIDVDFTSLVKAGDTADRLVSGVTNMFVTAAEHIRIQNAWQIDDFFVMDTVVSPTDDIAFYYTDAYDGGGVADGLDEALIMSAGTASSSFSVVYGGLSPADP